MVNLRGALQALLLALCVACATPTATDRGDVTARDDFVELHAEASETLQRARALGFEWIDTEGMLDRAAEAEASGNASLAMQLASEALRQADLSIAQASREAEAWQKRAARWQ